MRVDQVPQDHESIYDGHRKAVYALTPSGLIAKTSQSGWVVESYFNDLAWQDVGRLVQDSLARHLAGKVSPLRVHLDARMTSIWVLSRDAGVSWWRTWIDMYPYFFSSITDARQKKYERALHLPAGTLGRVDIYFAAGLIPELFDELDGNNR
ncbi:MAG: hypothetical protein NTV34_14755 [Proteobacteria bacterium]|nr:hypothetical protein [Pseudomonadota bacterium]